MKSGLEASIFGEIFLMASKYVNVFTVQGEWDMRQKASRVETFKETGKDRILVVDDHPLIRQGLMQLINSQPDMEVVGEAKNGHEAIEALSKLDPDLAIIDITLEDLSGIDLIKDLKARYPDLSVLVLSMHDESIYAERALRAGARGFIMKGGRLKDMMTAIRKVHSGEVYLSDTMTARLMHRLVGNSGSMDSSPMDLLTERELRIMELIGEGMGPSRIAKTLHLSVKTIETHRAHIKEKLGLDDAAAVRRYAIQWTRDRGPE